MPPDDNDDWTVRALAGLSADEVLAIVCPPIPPSIMAFAATMQRLIAEQKARGAPDPGRAAAEIYLRRSGGT